RLGRYSSLTKHGGAGVAERAAIRNDSVHVLLLRRSLSPPPMMSVKHRLPQPGRTAGRGSRVVLLGRPLLLVHEPVDAAVIRPAALVHRCPADGAYRHRALRLPALLRGLVLAAATDGRQHVGGPVHSTHSLRLLGRSVFTEST